VSFLSPYITDCADLTCFLGMNSLGRSGTLHRTKTIKFFLSKFVGTIVSDHAKVWNQELESMKPIVQNKPEKRKVLKMRKTQ